VVPAQPPATTQDLWRSTRSNIGQPTTPCYINEAYLTLASGDQITTLLCKHDVQSAYLGKLLTCPDSGLINISDPQLYAAKCCGLHADNPTFQQALNSPAAAEYLAAMKLKIHTLVQQCTWVSVPQPTDKNVLKGT
jgi:hypothetical protein